METNLEAVARDLLVAYLSGTDPGRTPVLDAKRGAPTGEWIGDAYVALLKKLGEAREITR